MIPPWIRTIRISGRTHKLPYPFEDEVEWLVSINHTRITGCMGKLALEPLVFGRTQFYRSCSREVDIFPSCAHPADNPVVLCPYYQY